MTMSHSYFILHLHVSSGKAERLPALEVQSADYGGKLSKSGYIQNPKSEVLEFFCAKDKLYAVSRIVVYGENGKTLKVGQMTKVVFDTSSMKWKRVDEVESFLGFPNFEFSGTPCQHDQGLS